jgi:hypothetical protein
LPFATPSQGEALNRVLVELILDLAAFLDLSGEDTVREDAAVNQLEWIAWKLQRLRPDERAEFINYTEDYAEAAQRRSERSEYIEFLRSFAEDAGLTE